MKTLVVAALAALLCTAAAAVRAEEAKKPVPAPATGPTVAGADARKAGTAKAGAKGPERKGEAAAKDAGAPAEKPCEPVKPCSID